MSEKEKTMKSSPVSFGSLMVFTIKDNKPKATIPVLMKASFSNNPKLTKYNLQDTFHHSEKIDGTVHNAAKKFAAQLDVQYKNRLPKGSSKVILTEADFYVNPHKTEKRYFITAATNDDEEKIHEELSSSSFFYSARFGNKK